jgi:hypothetical protein
MKYFVVAGTRQEFNNFIRQKAMELFGAGQTHISLSDFIYVTEDSIRGHSEPHGWFIGTWRNRSDIKEILFLLRIAQRGENEALTKIHEEIENQ